MDIIKANYEQAASEMSAAISEPVGIIRSGELFQYARNLTYGGGKLFDTVYDEDQFADLTPRPQGVSGLYTAVGNGTLSPADKLSLYPKLKLNRDGFHSNLLGRYLIGALAYEYLTGYSVVGNPLKPATFRENISLPSKYAQTTAPAAANPLGKAPSLEFSTPSDEYIYLIQNTVHGFLNQ